MSFVYPGSDCATDYLLECVSVAHSLTGRLGQSTLNHRSDSIKYVVILSEGSGANFWADLDSTVFVDDTEN